MVKIMSTPVILAFCVVGIVLILLNMRIDSFDIVLVFLLGAAFEELRRQEKRSDGHGT